MGLRLNSSVKMLTPGPRVPSMSARQLVLTALDSPQDEDPACLGLRLLGPMEAFLLWVSQSFYESSSFSFRSDLSFIKAVHKLSPVSLSTTLISSTRSLMDMYSSCPIDPGELTDHQFLKRLTLQLG